MATKRFRTRRYWHSTTAWMVIGPVLFLTSFVLMEVMGEVRWMPAAIAIFAVVLIVAFFRDRTDIVYYEVDRERVVLHSGQRVELVIPIGQVRDASVVDRQTAMEYVRRKRLEAKNPERAPEGSEERYARILHFCTIDLSSHSYLTGLSGRLFVPMSRPKGDLVLLRLRDGREFVLSPVHYQDMVSTITRSSVPSAQQRQRA